MNDSKDYYLIEIALMLIILFLVGLASNGCTLDHYNNVPIPKAKQCTVSKSDDITTIACPDGTKSVVRDGVVLDGLSPVVEVIDPCGDGEGEDEIILIFDDLTILAWIKNVGLVDLSPGTYVTTDRQRCVFTVTLIGDIIY